MIATLKLSHKLMLITGLLALPLLVVTTMYVRQSRQVNLNALEQQITVLPVLRASEDLSQQMQDYSAGIPLWILGAERSPDEAPRMAQGVSKGLQELLRQVQMLEDVNYEGWNALARKIREVYSGDTQVPRAFNEYTDLTNELINQTRILAYKYKLYSGTDQLIVINRMILDLAPALAHNTNQLRGLVTYKIFVDERSFQDVAVVSGNLSLVQFRHKEIEQSLDSIASSEPKLYTELNATRTRIDRESKDVTRLVQMYIDNKESGLDSAQFFEQASQLMGSIHRFSRQGQIYIHDQLQKNYDSGLATLRILVALGSLSAFVVLLLVYVISRSFVSGVRQIEIVTEQIAKGNRQLRFPDDLSGHEVKSIMAEIHNIHLAISAYEERTRLDTWVLEGQKNLNEQLRMASSLVEFAEQCLITIASNIKADVAAFYRCQEGGYRRLFNYGAHAPDYIPSGEGLLGAVAIDGHMRLYSSDEIPENYARVESSLGESHPRNLLIFPIRLQDEVIALMEFLSLHPFDPSVKRYLEAIEENTAILLRSLLSKIQVSELLETTRMQSRELQQTNTSLEEKSQQLNEQQNLLQQVNEELEEQRSELEIQNENLESAIRDLGEAKKDAEVANQSKSIFLANISHELRTPLNSIMILSQVLTENREGNLLENQVSNASTIYSAGKDLLKLINEILDLSKIEAGKIEINSAVVDLIEVSGDLRNMYLPLAQKKRIDFEVTMQNDCPPTVETDVVRISQIIRNFVGNAIKFTEKGSVKVDFSRSTNTQYALTISVRDTGIGIPKDQFELIFEPFKQLNNALSRKHEGTGLGLAISLNLASKLGCAIDVSSEVGQGSCFVLFVPAKMPLQPDDNPAPIVESMEPAVIIDDRQLIKSQDAIILIVEDDPNFAGFLQGRCRESRFRTLLSPRGLDCLNLAERFQPHGIILDIKLPSVDGLDLLAQLKSNLRTRHIPVHVISFSDREKEALGQGAISFLQKPVPVDKVDEILRSLQNREATSPAAVLLAVADPKDQAEIQGLFAQGKYQLDTLTEASDVLVQLGEKDYSCLITGLHDLVEGQFTLLDQIVKDKRLATLPIIVFRTGDAPTFDQQRLASYRESLSIREVSSMERLLDDVALFIHSVDSRLLIRNAVIPENVFENKKILIVDDDIRNIYALRQILHGRGCDIVIASNGIEALQTLSDQPDISLVLMDIMMPEMDGYEATRQIRRDPKFARLPIIALTAKAMKNDRQLCLDAGASDYLMKPIDNDRIMSLMRVWLSR